MDLREVGRERGRQAGKEIKAGYADTMAQGYAMAREVYPSVAGSDLAEMVRDYDRERLACEPDYAKFPEMKGLLDRHLGEREGFREASGLDETATAFFYSWDFLLWRRINAHHVPYWELVKSPEQCTNVFIPEGAEGVTTADNRDVGCEVALQEIYEHWQPGAAGEGEEVHWRQGQVSSAVTMDEEPECCFPCDPDELCPAEALDDVKVRMEFMTRYREFWGPGNQIWVDRHLNAVVVEKTNCRVAYRWPEVAGAACTTACSYLDPELHAFKQECMRKVIAAKGQTEETNNDWEFDLGARERNRRLCELTNAEATRPGGATLWGALDIVSDEAVPWPERICQAGQTVEGTLLTAWSVLQHAKVITGPNRRTLYRSIQDMRNPRSVTSYTPKLLLGEKVRMQPEWQGDIDAGRCELVAARSE